MAPRLCLGTVQLGVAYGIAGSGERMSDAEARAILAAAWEAGVRRLDTAPGYGDVEQRLADLAAGRDFEIVTKIPVLPAAIDPSASAEFVRRSLDRSHERLGDAVCGVLFHGAGDLARADGPAAWDAAQEWCAARSVALGVSVYGPDELAVLAATRPVAMAQLPGNAFDQRIAASPIADGKIELTVRSAFLQGLLLMGESAAARRLPAAREPLAGWHALCRARGMDPLDAALGVVKGLPGIAFCAVGVDNAAQLSQIVAAWDAAPRLSAPELATGDPAVIDPRCWSAAQP